MAQGDRVASSQDNQVSGIFSQSSDSLDLSSLSFNRHQSKLRIIDRYGINAEKALSLQPELMRALESPRLIEILNDKIEAAVASKTLAPVFQVAFQSVKASMDAAELAHKLAVLSQQIVAQGLRSAVAQDSTLTIHGVIDSKKSGRPFIRQFVEENFSLGEGRSQRLIGALIPILDEACEQCLGIEGSFSPYRRAAKQLINLSSFHTPFLQQGEKLDLALRLRSIDPKSLRDYLLELKTLPNAPLRETQADDADQVRLTLQKTLVNYIANKGTLEQTDLTLLKALGEFFERKDVLLAWPKGSSGMALITALGQAIALGQLRIKIMSCPDYSGEFVTDADGKRSWQFDFKALGHEVGIVAERGFGFVRAFAEVFGRYIPDVQIQHYEPTFEIANGFKGSIDETGKQEELTYIEARQRLQRSGERIRDRYNSIGLTIESGLMCDLINDGDFVSRKLEIAQKLREEIVTDQCLKRLVENILRGRKLLYHAWYQPTEVEGEVEWARRISHEVIPNQIAEYIIFGDLHTKVEQATVLLCYDSAVMSEVHAYNSVPALFGQGRGSTDYLGV